MSRGFVKEDDQEDIPMVPPRADLPEGAINYVTPIGMQQLLDEKDTLLKDLQTLDSAHESEKRIASNHINAKLQLLNQRILTAKIVDLSNQPQDEVRFGALVSLKIGSDKNIHEYQIVGVDEADISKGKISFMSPMARLLTDKKVGEKAVLKLPKEDRTFEIVKIVYPRA